MRKSVILLALSMAFLVSCRDDVIKKDGGATIKNDIEADDRISDSPSGIEILRKVAEAYKSFDTYQDEGVHTTKFITESPSLNHINELHFTTVYSQFIRFRFEYWSIDPHMDEERYVIWKNNTEVKSWWTINPEVKMHDDILDAASEAAGVSKGTSYVIPTLLMKGDPQHEGSWTNSNITYRIEDGVEADLDCFRLQCLNACYGKRLANSELPPVYNKVTYWITKSNYLLVRIEEETYFKTFITRSTTKYSPKINCPIPSKAFEFGH